MKTDLIDFICYLILAALTGSSLTFLYCAYQLKKLRRKKNNPYEN